MAQDSSQPEVRSAQPDDICILLQAAEPLASTVLPLQKELQAIYQGRPVIPVHFTCERFEIDDENCLPELFAHIRQEFAPIRPFSLTALGLEIVNSRFRSGDVLKWQVEIGVTMRRVIAIVGQILEQYDTRPFYGAYGTKRLVTALEDIRFREFKPEPTYPRELFDIEQVVLSRIIAPGRYQILESFQLRT